MGTVPEGNGGAPSATPGTSVAAVTRTGLAARLSKTQYAYSVHDVLGVDLTADELSAAAGGLPDDTGDGVFKNFADKQLSTEQHALAYFQTAEAIAKRADSAALREKYGACSDATEQCGAAAIAGLGRSLFRRPLTDREVEVYGTVYAAALEDGLAVDEALRWPLQAMLQAPPFLFRLEDETTGTAGQVRELSGYEIAARLASFLWTSVPDDALLAAAEAGELATPEGLEAQVTRLLADPKAQRFTEGFITEFSRARLAAFEGVTDEQREALQESVVATFQHHFWEAERSIAELFTTQEFLLNAPVAELLGVTYTGPGLQVTDVSGLPERVGLLSHPGMIAGMGDREVGSFVNRGKYLMERLLCRNPIALPAALQGELQNFNRDTEGLNEHERAAIRMTRVECWSCHTQFEPLAFGFSRFDGAGRYVGDHDAADKALPLDGWVPVSDEKSSPHYTNMAEYMQALATDTTVQTCMTEHFLSLATAHATDQVGKDNAKVVGADYLAAGSTLAAMVSAVVKSPLFLQIEVSAADAAPSAEAGN
jgi:Protein of unknown function (DUF1592)/Protein of unknown function (DUF1588)/Protein of unknown function (DUF1595)/Protein of unknown function (DUF1587)